MTSKIDTADRGTVRNGHLDTVVLKALALEHVGLTEKHTMHLLLCHTKLLGNRFVDRLCWSDANPLGVSIRANSDADHIVIV